MDTHVFIDEIIVSCIERIRPDLKKETNVSRKYVEILRYVNEDLIDGNHEMTIWIDPGNVEVQHVHQEAKDKAPSVSNEVLYSAQNETIGIF